MKSCREIRDLLPLWAGGDLTPDETVVLESHLGSCADCRTAAAAWRADLAALRADLAAEPCPALPVDRLSAAVDAAVPLLRRRPLLRRPAFWAAAAPLAAVLAVLLWWRFPAPGPAIVPAGEGVTWPELQRTFAGCLETPVPLGEWATGSRAGVVTVLAPTADGERYLVADCIEMSDLSRLRAYPWAEQRIASWRERIGDRLLVTVCPTGDGGRAERRRLRHDVLSRFIPRI